MTPTPSDLRKLVADRAVAAEKISRSPINLDDVQAYTDADVAARTAALLALPTLLDRIDALEADKARLDFIERTFSGMTNRERYLPVQMIWGTGCNGRTLREACDKYMARALTEGTV